MEPRIRSSRIELTSVGAGLSAKRNDDVEKNDAVAAGTFFARVYKGNYQLK